MSARTILVIFFLILACMLPVYMAPAQEQEQDLLARFEERVTEFTLDNGLRFIVIERHDAPVATFYTYADVGSVDEVKGITGLAHMFEHMAFKGTSTIGSTDYAAEQVALDKVDAAYDMLKAEQHKGLHADPDKIAELEAAFAAARDEAQAYSTPEFEEALERNGGTGLNASTANDRTDYFVSLPVNQTELWFSLESERFLDPVLREFYIERDVVAEERRMRTESNPFGRLLEEFWTTAFKAHPYGEPGIGHMSDIQSYTRAEAIDFFHKFYNPANLIVAIAGDVDPDEIRALAETYFGRLPEGARPDPVETVEPPQIGERRVVIEEQSQPIVISGWHKGSVNHPDQAVYDILERILSDGTDQPPVPGCRRGQTDRSAGAGAERLSRHEQVPAPVPDLRSDQSGAYAGSIRRGGVRDPRGYRGARRHGGRSRTGENAGPRPVGAPVAVEHRAGRALFLS